MYYIPADDDALDALLDTAVPSEVIEAVSYRIVWRVGEGGMSVVFYALRVTPEGETPVVVKLLRPSFVRKAGPAAALTIKKEAIALGRLNERVPPTPFVVRFIDTGTLPVVLGGTHEQVDLPWVVVEYVHGGAEGTTLSQRVEHSVRTTGSAFDPARAAHAVECLTSGLGAVHEVGVIHRDLKPDNVLCCGFGDGEIFKLADFGVARPAGVATFTGAIVGTPGFVAPELMTGDNSGVGSWSDIFSLAAVIFYLLTGEEYFAAKSPGEAIVMAASPQRRSLRDTSGLAAELRDREQACRSIDFALACATSPKIDARPRRADALAAMLLPWLQVESRRPSAIARRLDHLREDDDLTQLPRWTWTTLRNPTRGLAVRSVAWDGDGRCMAATNQGLAFWNGSTWSDVSLAGLPNPAGIRFVQRIAAGEWLVGGDEATFATIAPEGVTEVRRFGSTAGARFDRIAGDLDDLAVLVGSSPGSPPTLSALSGRRWLKPLPLPGVAAISSIARVEDARFLVAGRGEGGGGFAALYAPLAWEIERLPGPEVRAYLSSAAQWDRQIGIITGADGSVIWRQGGELVHECIEGGFDLSASGVDAVGRGWAASAGRIWMRRAPSNPDRPAAAARWDCVFCDTHSPGAHDADLTVADKPGARVMPFPIVSLFTDLGVVIAMTAECGLIEGRVLRAPSDEASSAS